ncbi:MAG TPA: hypothetical protein VLH79_14645 [Chthonomonadales bacterium]|nr:hypothetical protein [Chthonomonadales bacterium]
MGLSRRLRNIALSQINAIKERLDRIDAEAEEEELGRRLRGDARRELNQTMEREQRLRSPDEIAGRAVQHAGPRSAAGADAAAQTPAPRSEAMAGSPLAKHYRVLGLTDGEDLAAVEGAYARLSARCAPERFAAGSDEEAAAREILGRVDAAYNAIREALDPTAGRFDKLEI